MLGEFTTKIRALLMHLSNIMPNPQNIGEVFRGRGKQADFNITIDDTDTGSGEINLFWNVANKDDNGYSGRFFEKGETRSGWIRFAPNVRTFEILVADGGNAGELIDWNWTPLISSVAFGSTDNPDVRLGIGVMSPPQANLHVKGKVRIDDTTSTTATAGTATLPTNPVAFLTLNINGTNYKIPLYGV